MHVAYGIEQLSHHVCDGSFREARLFATLQKVLQITALTKLHYEVQFFTVFNNVEQTASDAHKSSQPLPSMKFTYKEVRARFGATTPLSLSLSLSVLLGLDLRSF